MDVVPTGFGLGYNVPSWDLLVNLIQSGRFSKIGTLPVLVDGLQQYAQQNGVELFDDVGTAPHVHLEVPL